MVLSQERKNVIDTKDYIKSSKKKNASTYGLFPKKYKLVSLGEQSVKSESQTYIYILKKKKHHVDEIPGFILITFQNYSFSLHEAIRNLDEIKYL